MSRRQPLDSSTVKLIDLQCFPKWLEPSHELKLRIIDFKPQLEVELEHGICAVVGGHERARALHLSKGNCPQFERRNQTIAPVFSLDA